MASVPSPTQITIYHRSYPHRFLSQLIALSSLPTGLRHKEVHGLCLLPHHLPPVNQPPLTWPFHPPVHSHHSNSSSHSLISDPSQLNWPSCPGIFHPPISPKPTAMRAILLGQGQQTRAPGPISLPPLFVNRALLQNSHIHSFTNGLLQCHSV